MFFNVNNNLDNYLFSNKNFYSQIFGKSDSGSRGKILNERVALLEEELNLTREQVDKIKSYVRNELSKWQDLAKGEQRDLHLRFQQTGLSLPMQITKEGEVFLLLKKYGQQLGAGEFRKVKTAICLSDMSPFMVAHSTQRLDHSIREELSNKEIQILKKISSFLSSNPQAKGLLRFYRSIDYQAKSDDRVDPLLISENSPVEKNGYSPFLEDLFDGSSVEKNGYSLFLEALVDDCPEEKSGYSSLEDLSDSSLLEGKLSLSQFFIEKRAVITKLYNKGNLQEALSSLGFSERKKVAACILEGLAHLHALNIFHSDLKESNIFLEVDPTSKNVKEAVIGDLGFACDLSVREQRFYKNGSREYRAPEMLEARMHPGIPIDEKILLCDVYAMGLILERLFSQDSTPELKDLIRKMQAKEPLKRLNARDAFFHFQQIMGNENS